MRIRQIPARALEKLQRAMRRLVGEKRMPPARGLILRARFRSKHRTGGLSPAYGVSRGRVRQIAVRAFEKLQRAMLRLAGERRLPPARGLILRAGSLPQHRGRAAP